MIFLYSLLLLCLGAVRAVVARRVAGLERRYAQAAKAADRLVDTRLFRQGNSTRLDPFEEAKRHYQLGLLVQKRDRLEDKHMSWQAFADKYNHFVDGVRDWKGKKLPYTFGAVDVSCVFCAIDYFGVGAHVSPQNLYRLVMSFISG